MSAWIEQIPRSFCIQVLLDSGRPPSITLWPPSEAVMQGDRSLKAECVASGWPGQVRPWRGRVFEFASLVGTERGISRCL